MVEKVHRGRPKGSKNKKVSACKKEMKRRGYTLPAVPGILVSSGNKTVDTTENIKSKDRRFFVEEGKDEVSDVLQKELRISTWYLYDRTGGSHPRIVARIFDARLADLIEDFLNGTKRIPRNLKKRLEELDA